MDLCIHCLISGKVQGVWFRDSTRVQAEQLEITGWVQNLNDGRVEVLACGERDKIELFYAWLNQGPQHAQVTSCARENLPWEEHMGFIIK